MSAIVQTENAYRQVLALTGALFLSYLAVAMALPAVPIYVVDGLHLSNAYGGLAVGVAFFSTIFTRASAGTRADRIGGKTCMRLGLCVYAAAGLVCLAAGLTRSPAAFPALIVGRLLLGLGESLAMVGMVAWAIGLLSPARSGQVISLVGVGMYGAFAVGGPLGLALLDRLGFPGLMAVCTAAPLLGLLAIGPIPAVAPHAGPREPLWRILGRIWRAGAAVGLQGVGFAALGAFFSLYFLKRGWPYAGLGLTCFGVGFVAVSAAVRPFAGPDRRRQGRRRLARRGGPPGNICCGSRRVRRRRWAGALLTGIGCSMVFPAMGSEVVMRTPPHLRGIAVGGFAAFQDLAYGATGPLAGAFADRWGYPTIFLIGGLAATLGIVMVLGSRR